MEDTIADKAVILSNVWISITTPNTNYLRQQKDLKARGNLFGHLNAEAKAKPPYLRERLKSVELQGIWKKYDRVESRRRRD